MKKRISITAIYFTVGLILLVVSIYGMAGLSIISTNGLPIVQPSNSGAHINKTTQSSTTTSLSMSAIPFFDLNYLNTSEAVQYNIHGLLKIGSAFKNQSLVSVSPGQDIRLYIEINYTAFDSKTPSVQVSFNPVAGEESSGTLDISGLESFSPNSLNVASNHPVIISFLLSIPSNASPTTFRLLSGGATTSPTSGIAVLFENDIQVNVS